MSARKVLIDQVARMNDPLNAISGNVIASQFFQAANSRVRGVEGVLAEGDYAPLRNWLTKNVYQHGRTCGPQELLERATGRNLDVDSHLKYLNHEYSDLYGL